MDRFVERKKKVNDYEYEAQYVLLQRLRNKKYEHTMSSILSSALLNAPLVLLSRNVYYVIKHCQMKV